MTLPNPRRDNPRTPPARVIDATGRVWGHSNPFELYRWVAHRNDLLRTIAASPRARSARA